MSAASRERDDQDVLERQEGLLEPLLPEPSTDRGVAGHLTAEEAETSKNVRLALLYTWAAFAGRSMWSQSVLATFVYLLKSNDPEAVGYITAVMGIAQLISSFPAGFASDYYRRDVMLKVASLIGVVAIVITLLACKDESYIYLIVALAIWGCFWGVANTALTALFADSIRTGERSKYFTQRSILNTLGNVAGPLAALFMFLYLGNNWKTSDCAIVMAVGQIICFPAVVLLCFFNDDDAIAEESISASLPDQDIADGSESGTIAPSKVSSNTPTQDAIVEASERRERFCCCFSEQRRVAILVAAADLAAGLGSGMSIRYFPIFFVDYLKLDPVQVQVLYCISPISQALLMYTAQRLSKRFGRCRVAVAHKWIGVLLMFCMILAYKKQMWTWLVCAIYVFRSAFINSTGALTRSVLMDNVPKEERGMWSALESVNMFSWSGSAALGGILVRLTGILPLFAATACCQFLASFALLSVAKTEMAEE